MNTSFEWDEKKNEENIRKHGVAFAIAKYAFKDKKRVISEDLEHSKNEKRYYCFGKVKGDVLTVRFTFRGSSIRIIGLVYGEKEKKHMKKKTKYTDEPIKFKVIPDFLPRPENLIFEEKKTRVTLTLSDSSLDFFKKEAKKRKASYQGMIRRLLDFYVANQ